MDNIEQKLNNLSISNQHNIYDTSYNDLKNYYDNVLNKTKNSKLFTSSNDESTPTDCIIEMLSKIPDTFWMQSNIKILDPCCGNGNFNFIIHNILSKYHTTDFIINNILYFNDTNKDRLNNVYSIFKLNENSTNITQLDFLNESHFNQSFDMIVANPPYAKMQQDGKRASKNHNLIKPFLEKSLQLLKPNGYLIFITPDNWMSLADRNEIIEKLTQLQFIYLNIHSAKKWFPKIGSSFTWYIIQNKPYDQPFYIEGIYNQKIFKSKIQSCKRDFIPLLYTDTVQNILKKTIESQEYTKFNIETSSDLHKYTKRNIIKDIQDDVYKYKLIHTPKQTCYANRAHKFQDGFKVFISTTDKYKVFVDSCGMTQSIAFIRCSNENEANNYANILRHPLYIFLNNICRWGNFNNIRILQRFPIPPIPITDTFDINDIYDLFKITKYEQDYIQEYL